MRAHLNFLLHVAGFFFFNAAEESENGVFGFATKGYFW